MSFSRVDQISSATNRGLIILSLACSFAVSTDAGIAIQLSPAEGGAFMQIKGSGTLAKVNATSLNQITMAVPADGPDIFTAFFNQTYRFPHGSFLLDGHPVDFITFRNNIFTAAGLGDGLTIFFSGGGVDVGGADLSAWEGEVRIFLRDVDYTSFNEGSYSLSVKHPHTNAGESGPISLTVGEPVSNGLVDSDGDGQSDDVEEFLNTDSRDPSSFFAISEISVSENAVSVSWPTVPGAIYHLEFSETLEPESWKTIQVVNGTQDFSQFVFEKEGGDC